MHSTQRYTYILAHDLKMLAKMQCDNPFHTIRNFNHLHIVAAAAAAQRNYYYLWNVIQWQMNTCAQSFLSIFSHQSFICCIHFRHFVVNVVRVQVYSILLDTSTSSEWI